jgi:hypothetical protein
MNVTVISSECKEGTISSYLPVTNGPLSKTTAPYQLFRLVN